MTGNSLFNYKNKDIVGEILVYYFIPNYFQNNYGNNLEILSIINNDLNLFDDFISSLQNLFHLININSFTRNYLLQNENITKILKLYFIYFKIIYKEIYFKCTLKKQYYRKRGLCKLKYKHESIVNNFNKIIRSLPNKYQNNTAYHFYKFNLFYLKKLNQLNLFDEFNNILSYMYIRYKDNNLTNYEIAYKNENVLSYWNNYLQNYIDKRIDYICKDKLINLEINKNIVYEDYNNSSNKFLKNWMNLYSYKTTEYNCMEIKNLFFTIFNDLQKRNIITKNNFTQIFKITISHFFLKTYNKIKKEYKYLNLLQFACEINDIDLLNFIFEKYKSFQHEFTEMEILNLFFSNKNLLDNKTNVELQVLDCAFLNCNNEISLQKLTLFYNEFILGVNSNTLQKYIIEYFKQFDLLNNLILPFFKLISVCGRIAKIKITISNFFFKLKTLHNLFNDNNFLQNNLLIKENNSLTYIFLTILNYLLFSYNENTTTSKNDKKKHLNKIHLENLRMNFKRSYFNNEIIIDLINNLYLILNNDFNFLKENEEERMKLLDLLNILKEILSYIFDNENVKKYVKEGLTEILKFFMQFIETKLLL
ncbi:hypothetical protein ABK040_005211 [Willaertia magna]